MRETGKTRPAPTRTGARSRCAARASRTRRCAPTSTARSRSRCRSRTPAPTSSKIELETAPGELTPANNRVVVAAEGVRENLRVLLVSGEPHAGERTWRNLLKSDAAVDLVHFTILRPPEKQDGTPINQLSLIAFPTRELFSEKIKDFDLIIFDRYEHKGILQLLYYDNIARYVDQHGGALLVAAGDDYASAFSLYRTPLSPVLPAGRPGACSRSRSRPQITDDGANASCDARACRASGKRRCLGRADVGPLVPSGRSPGRPRTHAHDGRRGQAAADPRSQGQGPRRAAHLRSRLAVGARLRRRRPAHRPAPPAVALADEGARSRRGAADRVRQGPEADARAPLDGGRGLPRQAAGPGRRRHGRDPRRSSRRAGRVAIDHRGQAARTLQGRDAGPVRHADGGRQRRRRGPARNERGDGDRRTR